VRFANARQRRRGRETRAEPEQASAMKFAVAEHREPLPFQVAEIRALSRSLLERRLFATCLTTPRRLALATHANAVMAAAFGATYRTTRSRGLAQRVDHDGHAALHSSPSPLKRTKPNEGMNWLARPSRGNSTKALLS
jgi:hypothetical protein